MSDRLEVTTPAALPEEGSAEQALRPSRLDEFVVCAHGVFDLFFDVEVEHGGRWVRNMCFSIQDFSQRRKHGKLTKGTKNAKKCFEVFIL